MSSLPVPDHAYRADAKEYARFCRLRRLFLVDGLETWRKALQQRKLPQEDIDAKIDAATRFVRGLGQSFEREQPGAIGESPS